MRNFEIWTLSLKHSVFIAIGAFVVIFTGVYFILHTSDRSLARRIDNEYKLDEKVQTMLAFKEDGGILSQLQREDANKAIDGLKIKSFSIKKLWWYILLFLAGAGVLVASCYLKPVEEPEPVIPETPFAVTELQIVALEELVQYVETSKMDEPFKANTVSHLNTLLAEIRVATTVTAKELAVNKAMDSILIEVDNSSVALELMEALWNTKNINARLLAKALNYYEWPLNDEMDAFVEKMTIFRSSIAYVPIDSSEAETVRLEAMKGILAGIGGSITTSVRKSEIAEDDLLCIALVRLASANEVNEELGTKVYGMQTLADLVATLGYENTQRELDATVVALNTELYKALARHSANTGTGEYAITRVSALFGCPAPTFERPLLTGSLEDDGSDGGSGVGGGIGNGTVYGSDDLVFDPYTGEYVEYGVILDRYYDIMFGMANGGEYTEDEKKALEKYFKILYGGFEETEE
ncbi:MAG: hypothetical protein J6B34_05305 [Clostridia bacterium]|nr:hypothetical protein [Clostridia bacterium]